MKESKEKIKSRMIQNASRLWGYQDTQAESSFDPFVGMILGSLAGELEKVSDEIAATESRVVERLVELLTPEPVTGPYPTHAIVTATPTQPRFTLGLEDQFYIYKKKSLPGNHAKVEEKSVFFTPTSTHKLFRGKVKNLATGKKLFEIQEEQYKEVIASTLPDRILPLSSIWIGLELDDNIESINGLSLCFELKNIQHEEMFYHALGKGTWTLNGHALKVNAGFKLKTETTRIAMDSMIRQEMQVCSKIFTHVNHYYQKRFVTFSNGAEMLDELTWQEKFPSEFRKVFSPDGLENLDQSLNWIRVELPEAIPSDVLEDATCTMNCFPVINRRLNEFTQTSRDFINIIPLQTEDAFLDIKSVTNTEGKQYSLKSLSRVKGMEKGAYILRRGGVGRFDKRNAMEILNYLLELLRDESAAFAVLGTDMISSNLRELNQMIARLEQRLLDSNITKEDTSYLALRAHPDDETVFVEFWSTQGVFANNIKAGSKLNVYQGSDIAQNSVSFVTPTIGGRERLDTQERIHAYRKSLLTHGRIVTTEDIKALCYEHFGKGLESVEVKKGMMKGQGSNQGFIRTIDIHLILSRIMTALDTVDLNHMKEDLLVKLREQSANVLPYRCFLNGEN